MEISFKCSGGAATKEVKPLSLGHEVESTHMSYFNGDFYSVLIIFKGFY